MASLPKPIAESYWVIPGRLLAGKNPGGKNLQELERRLGALLDAGFDAFIDLTEPGELPAYDGYLPEDAVYLRKPIKDHGVPPDSAYMAEILAEVDALLESGRRLYVHCRAGMHHAVRGQLTDQQQRGIQGVVPTPGGQHLANQRARRGRRTLVRR